MTADHATACVCYTFLETNITCVTQASSTVGRDIQGRLRLQYRRAGGFRQREQPRELLAMDSRQRTRWILFALVLAAVILVAAVAFIQRPQGMNEIPPAATSPLAMPQSPLPTATSPQAQSPLSSAAQAALLPSRSQTETTPIYRYQVAAEYPHAPDAYTQGLQYLDGVLYEGTGERGESSLRRVALETGEVLQSTPLSDTLFGEGITVVGDRIFQLTWQSNVGFIYDRESFDRIGEFAYPTEGWGLTYDGQHLIMSDGSSTIYRRDVETLAEVERIEVTDQGKPVVRLNELEMVNGEIWANVWQTDRIARIDPETGVVVGWIDLSGLLPAEERIGADAVLNGIAYDAENDRVFVTGKNWPKLFEIEIVPADQAVNPEQ